MTVSNTIWGALEKYKLQIHESCGGVVDEADFIAGYRAAPTQQSDSEPCQVVGRVHYRHSGVGACLNSIGRQLPDNAPLYTGPQPSAQVPSPIQISEFISEGGKQSLSTYDLACQLHDWLSAFPSIAEKREQSEQVPEAVLESLWRHTKGVDPETGEAWVTPRMASIAGKLSNALQDSPVVEKQEWISFSDRNPESWDADMYGEVWVCHMGDTGSGIELMKWSDAPGGEDCYREGCLWMKADVERPEPPEEK